MKDNRFEGIAKLVSSRVESLAKSMASDNSKQRPFGVEKVEPVDKVYIYDKLDDTRKLALIQKHGLAAWQAYEADVKKIKQTRGII